MKNIVSSASENRTSTPDNAFQNADQSFLLTRKECTPQLDDSSLLFRIRRIAAILREDRKLGIVRDISPEQIIQRASKNQR